MDKFCIGDAAYHELTIMNDGELQKSYLVKQCRGELNKLIHVTRTPGKDPGVQLSFREELVYQLEKISHAVHLFIKKSIYTVYPFITLPHSQV